MASRLLLVVAVFLLGAFAPASRSTVAPPVIRADLAISPDGRTVATSTGTGTVLLWDADTWTVRHRHEPDGARVFGFDFDADGRHVSYGTQRGRLEVLDVQTGAVVFSVQDRDASVSATRFGADDRLFASGQGRTLSSYDWRQQTKLRRYDLGRSTLPDGRTLDVEDFEVLPEAGRLFIARFDGQARLMDVATGAVVHTWRNKPRARDGRRNVKDVEVLPDERTGFFSGVSGEVIVVDLTTGARLDSVRVHPDFVSALESNADGTLVAANDLDGGTTLIETETRTVVRRLEQEASFSSRRLLFAVDFRAGTDEVVTGGIRLPLIVWDAGTGERLRTISELP